MEQSQSQLLNQCVGRSDEKLFGVNWRRAVDLHVVS